MMPSPPRLSITASPAETAIVLQAFARLWPALPPPVLVDPHPSEPCVAAFISPSVWMEADWSDDAPTRSARAAALVALAQARAPATYLCTLFRHVRPAERDALLPRLRKLNLLMATLSHQTGAFVVEFDRMLAATGAVGHGGDWRLVEPLAQDHAVRALAHVLLLTGLAERLGLDRAAAEHALRDWQPATLAGPIDGPPMAVLPGAGDGRALLSQIRGGWLPWRVLPLLARRFVRRTRRHGLGNAVGEVRRRF